MKDKKNTLKRGEARFKGITTAEVIAREGDNAPKVLLEEQYQFLGDEDLDFGRYTSKEFFEKEIKSLWPKIWQWACREEHIQKTGDTYVYEFGPYSVVVVRSSQKKIQAFLNTCMHRGTKICPSEGTGYLKKFRCPFHGWSWNLDGSINNIPGRWDFPHVSESTHNLQEVKCEVWGGFVFINLDLKAKPLKNYLEVLPDHFKAWPLERRHITIHIQKKLPANWKASQEAFLEAYHSYETHSSPTGANCQYDIFGNYVTRFIHNIAAYSASALNDYQDKRWTNPPQSETEMLEDFGFVELNSREVPKGSTAREIVAKELRESLGKKIGVDLSEHGDSIMLDSIQYHLFPNMFFFPGINIPMAYRFRPDGNKVENSIFDIFFLSPLPEDKDHPLPPEPHVLGVDDSYTEVAALGALGRIFDEDTTNLRLQQEGFHTSRKSGITLGNYQEARIRRIHQTLDEFLS